MIEPGHLKIPIDRQCDLMGLSRSGYYYQPQGESALNQRLMNLLDEQYTRMPFYGVEKMTEWLRRQGFPVNEKRVRRLLRIMGIEAIYPKPQLSSPSADGKKYPYLLRDLMIEHPNHVWSADITYVPLLKGFAYLVAILDWFSRYVLSFRLAGVAPLSNSLETVFCREALEEALEIGTPDIFNSDQGCQFTSADFTGTLKQREIQISMDGLGRCFDNIFVERLWRSVKYEDVYLKGYQTMTEAQGA